MSKEPQDFTWKLPFFYISTFLFLPSWMRNNISRSMTFEHSQEGKNHLPDRNIRVHFIKASF